MEINRIEYFSTEYQNAVQDVATLVQSIDVSNPTSNVLTSDATNLEIIKFQSESQASALADTLAFLRNTLPLQEIPDGGDGHPISVQTQKAFLENVGKRNYLATRMAQQRQDERHQREMGGYFDQTREPICTIPPALATNQNATVSDSALKLLTTFSGNTDNEADNLRQFLRSVYDVADTNSLNEECVKKILQRKLAGVARKLVDKYLREFTSDSPPSLRQLILKLEDRFMSDWSPKIASAKLSVYKQQPTQTFQAVEADICELVALAARGEKESTRDTWIKSREQAVFKQAINKADWEALYNENQTRSITGLPEMNMSQMVDYLIKKNSEQNALTTATATFTTLSNDADSIQLLTTKSNKQLKKEKRIIKQLEEKPKGGFQPNNQRQYNNYNGRRGNNRGRQNNNNKRNNGQNQTRPQGQPWNKNGNGFSKRMNNGSNFQRRGNNNNNNNFNRKNNPPRKFVVPSMVNVDPNSCLKCNSPTHRFQEQDRCVYGKGNLMTTPCRNCQEGGHHSSICIKNQKPNLGAQEPVYQEPLDPRFSKWPEANKKIPEYEQSVMNSKNEQWLPSLFPN